MFRDSGKMRIGTLFSGIGSPEQAAKRIGGYEFIFACEFDKYARQSFLANYEINISHFHIYVNDMDGTQLRNKVDLIVGGAPCQDFSIAGLRAGVEGHRGQLIWQYFRIIKEARPKYFIYENVKGMVSDRGGKTLSDFLTVFRSIGYNCHYEVLNTKDYGVPQNRERLFIVGFLDMNEYYNFQFAPKIKLEKRLKDILEECVDDKYYLSSRFIKGMETHKERHKSKGNGFAFEPKEAHKIEKANCLSCGYGSRATDTYIKEPKINQIGALDIKGNDQIKRVYSTDGLSPTLTTMGGGNREPKIQVSPSIKKSVRDNFIRDYDEIIKSDKPIFYSDCTSGFQDNKVCITESACLRANNDNLFALDNNYRIRKLTPRECLRLQDFGDSFKIVVSDTQAYKQAGNSISVNVMEMILRQLQKKNTDRLLMV